MKQTLPDLVGLVRTVGLAPRGWSESGTISLGFRIVLVSQGFHRVSQSFTSHTRRMNVFLNIRCVESHFAEGVVATACACGRTRADLRSRGDQRVMCAGFTRE